MTKEEGGKTNGSWPDQSGITSRDRVLLLMDEIDFDAQLIAIRSALQRNKEAEEAAANEIKELSEFAASYDGADEYYQMHLEGNWVDAIRDTVYLDAAHSMAAVGMLAPFVESLFVSLFDSLGKGQTDLNATDCADQRDSLSHREYWNPHFHFTEAGRRRDLISGIGQLAQSISLTSYFPDDYENVLQALFEYRNKMFHCGFEWPPEERAKFQKRINSEGWPADWFKKSTSGGDPWIFYMSDEFIYRILVLIDEILEGIGDFLANDEKNNSSV